MGIDALIMKRAVFLDRDGVVNQSVVREGKPYPALNVDEVRLLPGLETGLQQLKQAGFLLIVVTNQPDVGRGTLARSSVEAIHALLSQVLPLDLIRVCYHGSDGECQERKPLPGMLLEAAREFDIDLAQSFMIGDRWRDIDAGHAAGCRTLFIDYGYSEALRATPDYTLSPPDVWPRAVQIILGT